MVQINQAPGDRVLNAGDRSDRAVLISVGAALVILTNAVIFVLPPLLPVIQAQYGLSTVAQTTWLYTALTLGGGAGFIVLSRMADVRGDRLACVLAAVFVTVGALVPAVGDSYTSLLVGCALMGFGGAAQLLPVGFLRRGLGEDGITVGVAVLVVATGIGVVVGMIGGGVIVENLSLRSFFIILTGLSALTAVASYAVVPDVSSEHAESGGSAGTLGTVWMVAWVAAILLALTQGLVWGNYALIPLLVGIVLCVAWFRAQRRSSTPVFDPALIRTPFVMAACFCIGLFAFVNAAFLLLMSTYAQVIPEALPAGDGYGLGMSALKTGLVMLPFAATFTVGGALADGPTNKGRGTSVLVIASLICMAGLAWLALDHTHVWHYLVGAAVLGLGCSLGYAAAFTMVQLAVPEEHAGMATGVAGTFLAIGFAIGTAVVSGDLSAQVIPVPGTTLEVATAGLYGTGYWISAVFAALVIVTVIVSGARAARRTPAVAA